MYAATSPPHPPSRLPPRCARAAAPCAPDFDLPSLHRPVGAASGENTPDLAVRCAARPAQRGGTRHAQGSRRSSGCAFPRWSRSAGRRTRARPRVAAPARLDPGRLHLRTAGAGRRRGGATLPRCADATGGAPAGTSGAAAPGVAPPLVGSAGLGRPAPTRVPTTRVRSRGGAGSRREAGASSDAPNPRGASARAAGRPGVPRPGPGRTGSFACLNAVLGA